MSGYYDKKALKRILKKKKGEKEETSQSDMHFGGTGFLFFILNLHHVFELWEGFSVNFHMLSSIEAIIIVIPDN